MIYDEQFSIEDADDLPEIGPRDPTSILTAPPRLPEDYGQFSAVSMYESPGDTIEEATPLLEKSMVRALLRIMNSASAKEADVLKAVAESGELLGKKGKGTVNIIRSENAQINQIMERPELMDHIKKAAEGIRQVSTATDARIKTHRGGKGD